MKGPEHDPSSGVQGLRSRGQGGHRLATCRAGGPTAVDLLSRPLHPAGVIDLGHPVRLVAPTGPYAPVPDLWHPTVAVPADDVEVVVDPRWLADLDDPDLIISAGYVGPDRRRATRDEGTPPRAGDRRAAVFRRGIQVLLMTTLAVVSLTLLASHSAPPASHGPTTVEPTTAPSATGRPGSGHSPRSTPRQAARSELAAQRALARRGSDPAGAPGARSAGVPPATTDALRSAQAADAAVVAWIRMGAREQSAASRSTERTAAAERRAAASVARAERQHVRRQAGSRGRSTVASTRSAGGGATAPDGSGRRDPGPTASS